MIEIWYVFAYLVGCFAIGCWFGKSAAILYKKITGDI